jgi:sialate O-acetylesterase
MKHTLTKSRVGRMLLHIGCLCRGGKWNYHWAGVRRQFKLGTPKLLLPVFWLGLAWLLAVSPPLHADVFVSPLFTDNAVLQRETDLPVWGQAESGERVTVSFAGQTIESVADDDGHWEARLKPMKANVRGKMTVRGKNVVTLTNLITGDVWLCSGQSNMGLQMRQVTNAPAEIAAANLPDIRQFFVPNHPSAAPQPDTFIKSAWQPASPKTVGEFTAAGFFFAREIHAALGVPIGIINSSWGGTPIQPWIPLDVLKTYPGYEKLLARKQAEIAAWPARKRQIEADIKTWETNAALAKAANKTIPDKPWNPGPPDSGQFMPGQLYNGMIHPLIRYAIKGALWYQGESNAGGGAAGAVDYTDLQSRLIASWRKDFNLGDFPFYFVQLPNWDNPGDITKISWAFFREGQGNVLKVPNTGMAVTIDIGDASNIHPKNKQEAGRRLALLALANTYGQKIISSGPVMSGSAVEGDAIRVRFDHVEHGLVARGDTLTGFEIAAADGKFLTASAKIENDSVLVSNPEISAPKFVRYAWADNPPVSLFNGTGLPAAPFRTDNFPK